jgi:hypothetical protein
MNQWVFNITPDHSLIENIKSNENNKVLSARIIVENFDYKINPNTNDELLTLNKNGQYYFDYYGEISDKIIDRPIEASDRDKENFKRQGVKIEEIPQKYRHIIPVKLKKLNEKLEDYTFSLKAVNNYSTPYNHFKNKYTKFNEDDYETITKKLVFGSRSVFGRLFNSLPTDDQIEVLSNLMTMSKKNNIRDVGFLNSIQFLRSYIEDRIIETGKYIVKINELVESKFTSYNLNPDKLGFYDYDQSIPVNTEIKVDNIKAQAMCFKEMFSLDFDLSLLDDLENQISKNKDIESRFEDIFKKELWPIKVKI